MSDLNDKLAAPKGQRWLERDDESDPNGRIYRDKISGEIYHSVTRILGATMHRRNNKKALDSWLERPGSHQTREMAAARGTAAHSSAEYVLQTGATTGTLEQLNKRNSLETWEKMAYIERQKQLQNGASKKPFKVAPRVPWSASGLATPEVYVDGSWINVTAIHSR